MISKFPRVVFKEMPIKLETEMFLGFLDKDWSANITNRYPQFLKIKEIKSENIRRKAIKSEIIKIRKELKQKIEERLLSIKNEWQTVENITLSRLSEIIQTDYPKKNITGFISINPICPRFLDIWSFSVSFDHKNPIKTIAHEISHFLFFRKFKDLFPKISKKKYESPHKEWLLSELSAVIILNDKRITDFLGPQGSDYYQKHRELKVGGELLTKLTEDLYKKLVIENNDFSGFIREGLNIVNKIKI